MSTRAWRALAIALLLAILVVLAYRLAPRAGAALAPIGCDPGLHACSAGLPGGGQLVLGISPTPLRALQPLDIRVTISGSPARALAVEFTGRDMDMGSQRAPLSGSAGQFSGQAMLPVCVSARMEWLASVRVAGAPGPSGELIVAFPLSVSGHPGGKP